MAKKIKNCPKCDTGTLIPSSQVRVLSKNPGPGRVLKHAAVTFNVPSEVCTHCHESFTGRLAASEEARVNRLLNEFVDKINNV